MLRRINFLVVAVLLLLMVGTLGGFLLGEGSPGELLSGFAGGVLFTISFFYCLFRRTGIVLRSKAFISELHIFIGAAALGLILVHIKGNITALAGLSALALFFLLLMGLNLRFVAGRQVYRNLGSRPGLFFTAAAGSKNHGLMIEAKKALLSRIDSRASEAVFGLTVGHWLRRPWDAGKFLWLAEKEKTYVQKICGAPPGYLNFSQGWGRSLHIVLAFAIMIGSLVHWLRSCPYLAF